MADKTAAKEALQEVEVDCANLRTAVQGPLPPCTHTGRATHSLCRIFIVPQATDESQVSEALEVCYAHVQHINCIMTENTLLTS